MQVQEFVEKLEGSVESTDKITYYVSKAKGVVTLIAAHHFPDVVSCESAFNNTQLDFEEVANLFKSLEHKYKKMYLKTLLVDKTTVKHYDVLYNSGLEEETRKKWRAEDRTIVSSISFKYPNKE